MPIDAASAHGNVRARLNLDLAERRTQRAVHRLEALTPARDVPAVAATANRWHQALDGAVRDLAAARRNLRQAQEGVRAIRAHPGALAGAKLMQENVRDARKELRRADALVDHARTPIGLIQRAFGADAPMAVKVASNESEFKLNPTGGGFQGWFQFDNSAVSTYGWGIDPVKQVLSAERMHAARGWQPWPNTPHIDKPINARGYQRAPGV